MVHRPQEITGFIDESLGEILNYAEGQAQVPGVMRDMVEDLLIACVDRYRPTLERWRSRLAEERQGQDA